MREIRHYRNETQRYFGPGNGRLLDDFCRTRSEYRRRRCCCLATSLALRQGFMQTECTWGNGGARPANLLIIHRCGYWANPPLAVN